MVANECLESQIRSGEPSVLCKLRDFVVFIQEMWLSGEIESLDRSLDF